MIFKTLTKVSLLLLGMAITFVSYSQGHREILFKWSPNPTELIRLNRKKYFNQQEYIQLVNCKALGFETEVDFYNKKIVTVKYSTLSSDYNDVNGSLDISDSLALKIAKILVENIKITRVKVMHGKDIPREPRKYIITLDFEKKDQIKALKWK